MNIVHSLRKREHFVKNSIDFIGGDTRRSLLRMVGPLLAAMVLTMAYNLMDSL